ncbi:MAG: Hsp20/alpha crystallin family protein [Sulfurovum sp.]|nr:Hsp20/alpha crystallin family protein [Sulfurovum sp.]
MLNKLLIGSVVMSSFLISAEYIENLNEKIEYNKQSIQKYKKAIEKLEDRNKHLLEIKNKNPQLYIKKPLFENNETEYIYRIKLNGAEAKTLNFTIENHIASVEMTLKVERNTSQGYYSRSQSFYKSFSIPKDVNESAITNKMNGDYFEIVMPRIVKRQHNTL